MHACTYKLILMNSQYIYIKTLFQFFSPKFILIICLKCYLMLPKDVFGTDSTICIAICVCSFKMAMFL